MSLIEHINSPNDLKKLNNKELNTLSYEIRKFLVDNISKTGGHLASNLGVVELTIAMNKVFDFPHDKIVFDVGHQSYVHKILTGRRENFTSLRQFGGISGFPKVKESEYDAFDTGHSSNSISVALGMKRGYQLNNDNRNVIALLGDGSFGGGMVFEALNDAGQTKDNIIVILNDNQMSISKNSSSISKYLNKIRIGNSYIDAKHRIENIFEKMPRTRKFIKNIKNFLKYLLIKGSLFEDLGFKYYGPYDGHNVKELIDVFEKSKNIKEPMVIHVLTKKGKGYKYAEERPDKFHGISKFDISTGKKITSAKDYSSVFGDKLIKLAKDDEKIVAVTAAMPTGTGLANFSHKYKERFFDVGIAEQHAVSMCGGFATTGYKPVFAVYSSFLQRGYDQIINDIALMNLHVVFGIDRAGLVGEDGETHQGVFDISYLNSIPNLTILSPANFSELEYMLEYALNEMNSPVAIRYKRGSDNPNLPVNPPIRDCKVVKLNTGESLTIVAEGNMVGDAIEIVSKLKEDGVNAELLYVRFIKPLDINPISQSVEKTKQLVVMEDGVLSGGLGESILNGLKNKIPNKVLLKHIPDNFVEHGKICELKEKYSLDIMSVVSEIKEVFHF